MRASSKSAANTGAIGITTEDIRTTNLTIAPTGHIPTIGRTRTTADTADIPMGITGDLGSASDFRSEAFMAEGDVRLASLSGQSGIK
jgi:hypothetical protein